MPSVVFDLLQVALKEGAFELFWNEVVENGLLKEKSGPVRFVLTSPVCGFPCYPSVSLPRGFDFMSLHAPVPCPSTSSLS